MKKENNSEAIKKFAGKGVFPHQFAFTLLLPLRNIFLSPKQLIDRLELEENFNVLEIGPGPGYFSLKIAQKLTKGKMVLTDIQQEMLNYAKKRIDKKELKNVEYKLCNGTKLNFGNESFDRVFMVTVFGEVQNKEEYLREIHRILKRDEVLSISELAGDPDKMSLEELKDLVCANGFSLDKQFGSARNYTANFIKS